MPRVWLQTTWPAYRWVASGPASQTIRLTARLRLVWQSLWASANWGLSSRLLEQSLDRAGVHVRDPILIVGPWRSGSTVMHERLAAATGLAVPQTWQCMSASSFVLTGSPRTARAVQRPMDQLLVRPDSPQEDEFALLTLGIRSAYLGFLRPDRLAELEPTLDQQFWLSDCRWCEVWLRFLGAVLHTLPKGQQPLILKSPNHTYRLRAILARFPRARLVWMTRDPLDVFHSNMRMWRSMSALYGLTALDEAQLMRFVANALRQAADALSWCYASLPPSRLAVVSVEHLRADPEATVRALCERLELTSRQASGAGQQPLTVPPDRAKAQNGGSVPAAAADSISRLRQLYQDSSGQFAIGP